LRPEIFNDDQCIGPDESPQQVARQSCVVVLNQKRGDRQQEEIRDEASADVKNPLPTDDRRFGSSIGEPTHWDEIEDPGEIEKREVEK
jgi:hypothetical protein